MKATALFLALLPFHLFSSEPSQASTPPDSIFEITGIVQTGGVTDKMREMHGLSNADFQVISDSGSYFLEGVQDFSEYWGECVEIKGTVQIIGKEPYYVFGRNALQVESIKKIEYGQCTYDFVRSPEETIEYMESAYKIKTEKISGVLVRSERISPDIAWDYRLVLNEPFMDTWNQSEGPIKITKLKVSPLDFEMQRQFETYLKAKREVEFEGYKYSGYVHSVTFLVKSIDLK